MMFNIQLYFIFSFFSPSIRLQSGRTAKLRGNGPPLLFSPGLFGTMPPLFYNNFLNNLKKNLTIITINDFSPLEKSDIIDVTKSLCVDSIAYLSHSSFNPTILETEKINKAILLDPICVPNIDFGGVNKQIIQIEYPALLIKADKLYNSEPTIPSWQTPNIKGNVSEIYYKNVGHPDILDNRWANIAKRYGFWDTSDGEMQNFKDWKFNKNNLNRVRKNYRNYVSKKSIDFIFN